MQSSAAMVRLPTRVLVGVATVMDRGALAISSADRHAFQQATWLAKRSGAALRAFHVLDFIDAGAGGSEGRASVLERSLEEQLEGLVAAAAAERVRASYGLGRGQPASELLAEARRWEADLLVVSPRRRLGLGARVLHGSTTTRLIRAAHLPLWIVQVGSTLGIRRVGPAAPPAQASSPALEVAGALADIVASDATEGGTDVVVVEASSPARVLYQLRRAGSPHRADARAMSCWLLPPEPPRP
jgi:nucleotide-binding universal stress UspA family protein